MSSPVSPKEHYANHLAGFYSWMTGDFQESARRFKAFLVEHSLKPGSNKIAIDLGAGHGIQSIPLAETGFDVFAVDFNQHLLDELRFNAGDLPITIRNADIRAIEDVGVSPELIVCCGDTLAHLESKNELGKFIADVSRTLVNGGKVIFSFRDYSAPAAGSTRIIPVKSGDDRILTCILIYDADFVNVTDLLYERKNDQWQMRASTYRKIRLDTNEVLGLLTLNRFSITYSADVNGLTTIIAIKP